MKGSSAALGLRVRTARAIAVVVQGAPRDGEVLLRRELRLSDPRVPASAQPFHAGLGLEPAEARPIVERASRAVRTASGRALRELLAELASRDLEVRGVGLVRTSATDPASIANPHMHAHAAEGRLFHDALAEAVARAGLPVESLLAKDVHRDAAARLGMTEAAMKRALATHGKALGPPWRSDEKLACAAAWRVLAPGRRSRR